jgi:hypothetical protein
MSSWYPYRWVCDNCEAVHYYEPAACCRCKRQQLKRYVNNRAAVKALRSRKKQRTTKPSMVGSADSKAVEVNQGPPINLKDSPVEQFDNDLTGMSGETTVRKSKVPDDLSDMINNILEG